jgi:translation initiation factor 5
MLNIPSTVNDPNYRYQMPKMNLKIESKGNGIKTNIVNLNDVAKHLRTDEQYILKFFGFEKASQTTFKEAGGKNNTNYIINGEFKY